MGKPNAIRSSYRYELKAQSLSAAAGEEMRSHQKERGREHGR
jgi:hypothetical protein